jgi:dihydroorotase-like cyclic amidohydrolase
VNAHSLYHRHAITPYHGRVLHGKVRATFVNGIEVFRDGAMTTEGAGRLLPGTSLTSAND